MRILRAIFPIVACAAAAATTTAAPDPAAPRALYNTERDPAARPLDAATSAARLRLPPGFSATVFAAEPDVQNPVALAWDARGRLWVAENFTYAERPRKFDLALRDRVLIFSDADGDGRFDSRTVFADDLQVLTSVEIGDGGVWLLCPPRLLFVLDRNRDDLPDSAPEVVLDGFATSDENHHTFANGLRWGPDGWLYGRCGASSAGHVGAPGSTAAARVPVRGGIWRFHPGRKSFEAIVHGTTNPWGHDWDAHGELFFINTVNGHLWHGITGAHCVRSHTRDPNPHAYTLIDHHADHWHFDTGRGLDDAHAADAHGGGHVHVGMMIYQGDNWPDAYRGRLFTLNFHGRRANQDVLERRGSGYVATHAPDFFHAADPWFRGQEISCGPDGGVIVLDWSDTGECHEADGIHRTSGRIFKITHGGRRPSSVTDLESMDSAGLVALHHQPNEWMVRQARRLLVERANRGEPLDPERAALHTLFDQAEPTSIKLRALWSLHGIAAAGPEFLTAQLRHPDEYIRTWAVRLLVDAWPIDSIDRPPPTRDTVARPADALLSELARLAATDPSALVRLALASTLQRLPLDDRPALAAPLLGRDADATDQNLPLLVWYGLMPVADIAPDSLVRLALDSRLPQVRRLIARRLTEDIETKPGPLDQLLGLALERQSEIHRDILDGMGDALRGWHRASKPSAWHAFHARVATSPDETIAQCARELAVVFGDGRALDDVRQLAFDKSATLDARASALQALIVSRPPDLREICERLLTVRFLNPIAARGLAGFDDPEVADRLVASFRSFHPTEQSHLLAVLVSRAPFARGLLEAVAAGKIPRPAFTPLHARQIRDLKDPALTRRLAEVWGEVHDSPDGKRRFLTQLQTQLTPAALAEGDRRHGRAIFATACATCHKLFGQGAAIGPDLTGSGRDNLDFLLEHTVDPAAVVPAEFKPTAITLKDGRTLIGFVKSETRRTLTLQTVPDLVTFERDEIVTLEASPASLMPEGTLEALSPTQIRDLVAYLMSPTQVPLP